MTPEKQFDGLIEQWKYDALPGSTESCKRGAYLAAAEALTRLQAIEVPPAFALRLEARMRARARSLAAQPGQESAFPRSQAQSGRSPRTGKQRLRGGRGSRHARVRF